MKTSTIWLIVAGFALAAPVIVAPHAQTASSERRCPTRVEFEIYEMILNKLQPIDEFEAFLKSEHPEHVMPRLKFLVSDKTVTANGDGFHRFRPEYKPDSVDSNVWREIVADLQRKPTCTIEDMFSPMVPVRITTEEELDSLAGEQYGMFWENVRQRFGPSAVVNFSRVGFDLTGNVGALYYSYNTGGLSGAGYTVVVEMTDDGWRVREAVMMWIS